MDSIFLVSPSGYCQRQPSPLPSKRGSKPTIDGTPHKKRVKLDAFSFTTPDGKRSNGFEPPPPVKTPPLKTPSPVKTPPESSTEITSFQDMSQQRLPVVRLKVPPQETTPEQLHQLTACDKSEGRKRMNSSLLQKQGAAKKLKVGEHYWY